MKFVPVILCGGSGTRLWPLSRSYLPKQFLPLISERTMLQETALRVQGIEGAAAATAAAALMLRAEDPESVMLVMPADHAIAKLPQFHAAIRTAVQLAGQG